MDASIHIVHKGTGSDEFVSSALHAGTLVPQPCCKNAV